ncbi:LOC108351994 [Phodopus roborovskii]|uniref:LOC108351994 protein n=1 Tax=Phodopus roborovskii TaxID=109678 RepID=A0AAV0A392_PHORO|nr:LOC108351994 [Phodopus roborovskii]
MSSFPVVMFLITLLLSSSLTEGRVLTQIQKEPATSADPMTNVKDKIDCQGKGNKTEVSQRMCSTFQQNETACEDLANLNQNTLDLTTILTMLKECAHKDQLDPVRLCSRAHRHGGTKIRHQQDSTCILIYTLATFLDSVRSTLVSY